MKFAYTILYVPDVERALSFYTAAFGLERKFITDDEDYGELQTGGTTLAFAREDLAGSHGFAFNPQRAPHRPAFELALVCDDVPAAVKQALDAGASLLAAADTKPWGQTVAYVSDPNGFTIELCTPMG